MAGAYLKRGQYRALGYVLTFNKGECKLSKLPLNLSFCAVTAYSNWTMWSHGKEANIRSSPEEVETSLLLLKHWVRFCAQCSDQGSNHSRLTGNGKRNQCTKCVLPSKFGSERVKWKRLMQCFRIPVGFTYLCHVRYFSREDRTSLTWDREWGIPNGLASLTKSCTRFWAKSAPLYGSIPTPSTANIKVLFKLFTCESWMLIAYHARTIRTQYRKRGRKITEIKTFSSRERNENDAELVKFCQWPSSSTKEPWLSTPQLSTLSVGTRLHVRRVPLAPVSSVTTSTSAGQVTAEVLPVESTAKSQPE